MTTRRELSDHERSKRGRFVKRITEITRLSRREADALLRLPRRASVRVNRLSDAAEADIVAELRANAELAEIPWIPDAFHVLSAKHDLAAADVVTAGRAYIQNASSFVPVLALDARSGQAVLAAGDRRKLRGEDLEKGRYRERDHGEEDRAHAQREQADGEGNGERQSEGRERTEGERAPARAHLRHGDADAIAADAEEHGVGERDDPGVAEQQVIARHQEHEHRDLCGDIQ